MPSFSRSAAQGPVIGATGSCMRAAATCTASGFFSEKVSGVAAKRPEMERVLDYPEVGDVLVVTKPDRLARSTLELLRIVDPIGKEGASFKSLGDPWADTSTPHGRLMLTVLSGIAAFERDLILSRTNEGRVCAMADGTRFGCKPEPTKHQAREP